MFTTSVTWSHHCGNNPVVSQLARESESELHGNGKYYMRRKFSELVHLRRMWLCALVFQ